MPSLDYLKLYKSRTIQGSVLNIGLGPEANAAEEFIDSPRVTKVISLEILPELVNAYQNPDPVKHTVLLQDASTYTTSERFDVIYLDIEDDFTEEVFSNMKAVVLNVKDLLAPEGILCVEYQGDLPLEREFRTWILTYFHEPVIENVGLRIGSGYLLHYKKL